MLERDEKNTHAKQQQDAVRRLRGTLYSDFARYGAYTHALWNETFLYSEVPSSFLVNTVQTLSKSVYNCRSYWQKFRGTFLWPTVYT